MSDLRFAKEKTNSAKNEIVLAEPEGFLNPWNSLEPGKFQES
jgi:hypothetical protein